MSVKLTATLPDNTTDTLDVDAILTENDTHSATITEHPVEQGANFADHIRTDAEKLHLDLLFTTTPLTAPDVLVAPESAHDILVRWQAAGALLSFTCTLGFRQQMAIESVSTVRDAKNGGKPGKTGGLKIPLALKQIRVIQNALTQVTVSTSPNVAPKVNNGHAPTTPVDDSEAPSIGASLVDGVKASASYVKGLLPGGG